jgi:GntP family gluconate:H+ symporter
MHPLLILALGIFAIILLITVLRLNAFLALIVSAILVSLLAPLEPGATSDKISRVAEAFGKTAGSIGIVIALAVVIGKCMMDSGAADRIVRAFLSLLGQKRCSWALMSSGFILSMPVFFDTVFYLLVPLARSANRRLGTNSLRFALAITVGGVATHSLVPPTPGPLVMADQLGIDLGVMILFGAIIAIPCALAGMLFVGWLVRRTKIVMRPLTEGMTEAEPLPDDQLPALLPSALPILLPVVLVSMNTILSTAAKAAAQAQPAVTAAAAAEPSLLQRAAAVMAILGNINFAMFVSTAVAMWVLRSKRRLTKVQLAKVVEESLMSGGIIILITAAGGAFGAMLKTADIGPAIEALFQGGGAPHSSGIVYLVIGVLIACMMKVAQGSGTVSMITASAMVGAMIPSADALGYPVVLLATAIGGGSMIGSWMNDSGFWIFVKMTGLNETEGLKTWLPAVASVGLAGAVVSFLLALLWQTGQILWVIVGFCVITGVLILALRTRPVPQEG